MASMHAAAVLLSSLTIVVSPGDGGAAKRWTLSCGPAGGTLPRAAQACSRLARLRGWYAPTPAGTACTQLFGGPQTATVRGTWRGRPVRAVFTRRNGCEIARWNRVSFLFPGAFA